MASDNQEKFDTICKEVSACRVCATELPLGPQPVFRISPKSKILVIGQAPGTRVHRTGIPWNDPSGVQLRKWLNVSEEAFYNPDLFGIVPMGLCYPGKSKSGDMPPRPECAPLWHRTLLSLMPEIKLKLLIGHYAQKYYLGESNGKNLTETVQHYRFYLPDFFVLPHPSPRNRFWLRKNPWFEDELVPVMQELVGKLLRNYKTGIVD